MHGVDEGQAFRDAAFLQAGVHVGSDVNERPLCGNIEPQLLAHALHGDLPLSTLFHPFLLRIDRAYNPREELHSDVSFASLILKAIFQDLTRCTLLC